MIDGAWAAYLLCIRTGKILALCEQCVDASRRHRRERQLYHRKSPVNVAASKAANGRLLP